MSFVSWAMIFRPYGVSVPFTYSKVPLFGQALFPITQASYLSNRRPDALMGCDALLEKLMRSRGDAALIHIILHLSNLVFNEGGVEVIE